MNNTGHALLDPKPLISEERQRLDREAFLRAAHTDRKQARTLRVYRTVRLAFVRDPKATIRILREQGKSWTWICRVLAIHKQDAWKLYFDGGSQ